MVSRRGEGWGQHKMVPLAHTAAQHGWITKSMFTSNCLPVTDRVGSIDSGKVYKGTCSDPDSLRRSMDGSCI